MIQEGGLSVILPVLNERDNVQALLERFDSLRRIIPIEETVFVDDGSTDGTVEFLSQASHNGHEYAVRVVPRTKKLGQVDACITGSKVAKCSTVVVMDADLQHPPEVIPSMLHAARQGYDVVVGSRYLPNARLQRSSDRGLISRGAMFIGYALLPYARTLSDPMSGFFVAERKLLADLQPLSNRCKLLLYILATHRGIRTAEVPYIFADRMAGQSKTLGAGSSFIIKYLIEVATYMKIRGDEDPRFIVNPSATCAETGRA
jgi:dolichol-phosphate mannosyltransferase